MNRYIDNTIALRILYLLQQPFEDTDAYKAGIIDKHGKKLRDPKTSLEKDAYNALVRLVFNIKRLLGTLPGGESRIATLATGYLLVKEEWETGRQMTVREAVVRVTPELKAMVEEVAATNVTNFAPHPGEEIPAKKRTLAMVRRNLKLPIKGLVTTEQGALVQ